jgi:hypothetical protein
MSSARQSRAGAVEGTGYDTDGDPLDNAEFARMQELRTLNDGERESIEGAGDADEGGADNSGGDDDGEEKQQRRRRRRRRRPEGVPAGKRKTKSELQLEALEEARDDMESKRQERMAGPVLARAGFAFSAWLDPLDAEGQELKQRARDRKYQEKRKRSPEDDLALQSLGRWRYCWMVRACRIVALRLAVVHCTALYGR